MKRSLLSLLFLVLVPLLYAQEAVYTPTPKSPASGALNQMPNVTVSWYAITGSTNLKYQFQMDTSQLFNSPLKVDTTQLLITGYTAHELLFNIVYYWRVRAIDGQTSAWSQVWNFKIINEVKLSKPKDNDTAQDPNVYIEWLGTVSSSNKTPISGITHFDYQIDTDQNFSSSNLVQGTTDPTVLKTSTANLYFGKKYYWRVRMRHNKANSSWSPARKFTVLRALSLISPADTATNIFLNTTLKWEAVGGMLDYGYQIAKDASFNNLVEESSVTANTATASTLMFGEKYYWRAIGRHTKDTTEWSAPFSFTTINKVLLKQPTNMQEGVALKPVLTWTKQTGIVNYELWLDVDSSFINPILKVKPEASDVQFSVPKTLNPKSTYYWKMRAMSDGGLTADTSGWSPAWGFITTFGVGIPEKDNSPFSIYPNPTRGKIYVNMESGEYNQVQFELFDVIGSTLLSKTLEFNSGQNVKEISLDNIPKGVYIVRLKNGEKVINQKIILEK
jgi:hypothetical protein